VPDQDYPFTTFNFSVEIHVAGLSLPTTLCRASFSECDGLEMTMEVKTIREGGNNGKQIRLNGPVSYGLVTLKRGMTSSSFNLWDWFSAMLSTSNMQVRASAEIVMLATPDPQSEQVRFILDRCIPTKLKAPALNAKDGIVAIEELQLAYESLSLKHKLRGKEENHA
jgi:phage tail-like protein